MQRAGEPSGERGVAAGAEVSADQPGPDEVPPHPAGGRHPDLVLRNPAFSTSVPHHSLLQVRPQVCGRRHGDGGEGHDDTRDDPRHAQPRAGAARAAAGPRVGAAEGRGGHAARARVAGHRVVPHRPQQGHQRAAPVSPQPHLLQCHPL